MLIHVSAIEPLASFLASERAAEGYCNEELDGRGRQQYLDIHGSVSGLVEVEEDYDYDLTHIELNRRLILNA